MVFLVELFRSLTYHAESRWKSFGNAVPRVEADVLWKVLLFLAGGGCRVSSKSQLRWPVVSKLFSGSSLAKCDMSEMSLAPSETHLSAVKGDMKSLFFLVKTGSLNDLPPSDSFVFNLVKQALNLQVDGYLNNEEMRLAMNPKFSLQRHEKLSARLWKASTSMHQVDVKSIKTRIISISDLQLSLLGTEESDLVKSMLLPRSNLMRTGVAILLAWTLQLPPKKVRQTRLSKQLRSFRVFLEEFIKKVGTHSDASLSDFARAFGDDSRPAGDSSGRTVALLREYAALFCILEPIFQSQNSANATVGLTCAQMKEVS